MRTRTKLAAGTAAALLILGTASAAQAAIPGAGGVITACYDSKTGDVRIIDSSKSCKGSETLHHLEPDRPVGPQGPQGIQGVKGNTGATGATGAGPGATVPRVHGCDRRTWSAGREG